MHPPVWYLITSFVLFACFVGVTAIDILVARSYRREVAALRERVRVLESVKPEHVRFVGMANRIAEASLKNGWRLLCRGGDGRGPYYLHKPGEDPASLAWFMVGYDAAAVAEVLRARGVAVHVESREQSADDVRIN